MILYVNGDSHSAGAEAVNAYCFADDDPTYKPLKRRPHPDNLRVSYGKLLADRYNASLVCHAESGCSNAHILRTTYNYLQTNTPNLIIIGWATWEREEVEIDGAVYQFSAGLITDPFSPAVKEKYKEWVVNRTNPQIFCDSAQKNIHELHQVLLSRQIPHLFFNTYSGLTNTTQLDWSDCYIDPYDINGTYYKKLLAWGYTPRNPNSFHFGPDGHIAWADYLQNHLTKSL